MKLFDEIQAKARATVEQLLKVAQTKAASFQPMYKTRGAKTIPFMATERQWLEHELALAYYEVAERQVRHYKECEMEKTAILLEGIKKINELNGNQDITLESHFKFIADKGLIVVEAKKISRQVANESLTTARHKFYAMVERHNLLSKQEVKPFIELAYRAFLSLDQSINPDIAAIQQLADANFPKEIYPEWPEIRSYLKDGFHSTQVKRNIAVYKAESPIAPRKQVSIRVA